MSAAAATDPIDLIAACMPAFGATELGRAAKELRVTLPVPLVDGRVPVFELIIGFNAAFASAREAKPTLLPPFCPDRHINQDGTFCLYWRAVDEISIDRPSAGRDWWETLVRFLQMQFRAARLRRWPDGHGRAHGMAAFHQYRAERAAERLGGSFPADLADGRLVTQLKAESAEGTAIKVMKDGKRLFSVWQRSQRIVNLRRPCLCDAGSGRRPVVIRSCGNHAGDAAVLAIELNGMVDQERRFWEMLRGAPCCGTMLNCPLDAT